MLPQGNLVFVLMKMTGINVDQFQKYNVEQNVKAAKL